MLNAVSPLAGKQKRALSLCQLLQSSGVAESPCASTLAIVPFAPARFLCTLPRGGAHANTRGLDTYGVGSGAAGSRQAPYRQRPAARLLEVIATVPALHPFR